jgi:hypothetical protein
MSNERADADPAHQLGMLILCSTALMHWVCVPSLMQDPLRVHGALYALRLVTRKYELTDESERGPLHDLVEKTFPVSRESTSGLTCTQVLCRCFAAAHRLAIKTGAGGP